MRRPMMYVTLFFAAGIGMAFYMGICQAITALAVVTAAVALYDSRIVAYGVTFMVIVSIAAGIICFAVSEKQCDKLTDCEGEYTELTGIIITKETKNAVSIDGSTQEYTQFKIRIKKINSESISGNEKLLVKYYGDEDLIPGQSTVLSGIPEKPAGRKNPGCFDYSLYLKSTGINYTMQADSIKADEADSKAYPQQLCRKVQGRLYIIKEEFLGKLQVISGKGAAGLMRGVMFGEKTGLDEETLEEFQQNGTAHVLAVSGLHVGIIYGFLSMLWRWKKGRLFFMLIIAFFVMYMVMASFSPSVVRAVVMVWLHVFAVLTNRRYDMASAAFFTALLMMINNPMHLFNAGFQMSFLAVLTLALIVPMIKQIYSGIFVASIAVQIGLLPYTIYVFNYVSLASVFVNVPIIFLTGIIVPLGLCCMAAMYVCEPAFDGISRILYGLCRMMTELNSMTGIDGITVFDVKSPALWLVALYYLVLFVFVSEEGRLLFLRRKVHIIRLMACIVLTVSLAFAGMAGNDFKDSDMVFVDVGQGDCIHFRVGRNGDYMVDGGGSISYKVGKKTLKPYLLKNGASSLDGAFVTHLHTDHYRGIEELCREGMVERLYLYEGYCVRENEIIEETGLDKENITYLYAGQKVILGDGAFAEVLWPERRSIREYETMAEDEEDENQFSLVLRITVKGKSVLATGDVDTQCLDALAEKYGTSLDADILKVAHHGSRYSESENFAEAAKPEYAVFQVGRNNFGHPDKGIIENLRRKGIMIYRNDTDGAVAFDITGKGSITARTVRGE